MSQTATQPRLNLHVPVILNEEDYRAALQQLEDWIRAQNPELHPQIDALGALISRYEEIHHQVPPPDPIQAIRWRCKELGMTQNTLAVHLNLESGRLSEVLARKRSLTLPMIRRMYTVLSIPADVLIQPYDVAVNVPSARSTPRPHSRTRSRT